MCDCEYCIKCERCGHRADEHMYGHAQCHICSCDGFTAKSINEKPSITCNKSYSDYIEEKISGELD